MYSYNIQSITKEFLCALVADQAAENQQLEFKRYTFKDGKVPDKEKTDLLKEITALANAEGGIIIIGIDEEGKGVASKLLDAGCSISDFDSIQLAIQQAMLAKVRPRLYGISMKPIEVENDKIAIVISVPKSFSRPHAVNDGNKDNFFIRHSNGVTHMSVDDLRRQFVFSSSFKYEMRSFRQERIGMILGNECIGNLADGAKVLLHIIPLWSLDPGNNIDINQVQQYTDNTKPISGSSWSYRFNSDGYCTFGKDSQINSINTYAQIFRNGIIEAVDIRLMNYDRDFKGQIYDWSKTETAIYQAIKKYSDLLKIFDIPKPWYIFISLLNAKGFKSDSFYLGTTEVIDQDLIHAAESIWDDDEQVLETILKPTFDSLANSFGMSKSPNYDKQGNYTERR